MYRHALPPGFVLKSDKKAAEELAKKQEISLEEFLEVEVSDVTDVSFGLFQAGQRCLSSPISGPSLGDLPSGCSCLRALRAGLATSCSLAVISVTT
jgi:hypothetical protein